MLQWHQTPGLEHRWGSKGTGAIMLPSCSNTGVGFSGGHFALEKGSSLRHGYCCLYKQGSTLLLLAKEEIKSKDYIPTFLFLLGKRKESSFPGAD